MGAKMQIKEDEGQAYGPWSRSESQSVGMGIIPLCFKPGEDAKTFGLDGHERYTIDLPNKASELKPSQDVKVVTDNGKSFTCTVCFDTEVELAYFDHGGILQYVIRTLVKDKHGER